MVKKIRPTYFRKTSLLMEKSRYKSILSTTKDDNYDLRAAVVLHCNVLNCGISCKNF